MLGTFVLNVQYICPQCSGQLSPILGTFFLFIFSHKLREMCENKSDKC